MHRLPEKGDIVDIYINGCVYSSCLVVDVERISKFSTEKNQYQYGVLFTTIFSDKIGKTNPVEYKWSIVDSPFEIKNDFCTEVYLKNISLIKQTKLSTKITKVYTIK